MSLQPEIERYRSPHVRNLIWSLLSPELIETQQTNYHFPQAIGFQIYQDIQPQLAVLDRDDETLGTYLQLNNHYRLGIYFERCWLYLLQHSNRYRVLAHNLPIRADGRTIGEFDLVVEDISSQKIEHWELTLKFYLEVDYGGEIEWFGPNLKDRLSRKFHHLVDRQLVLSEHPSAQQYCESRGWHIDHRRLLSRGRLFYRFKDRASLPHPPAYVHDGHLTGMWVSEAEFKLHFSQLPECAFHCLEKKEWMTNLPQAPLSFNQISIHLQSQPLTHPIQIVVIHWRQDPQTLFLVPDHWLDEAHREISRLL